MSPHHRVHVLHRFPSHHASPLTAPRELSLLYTRVYRLQRSKERGKLRRQFLQGRDLRREESVSTSGGLRKEEEGGQAWRLELVRNVRMPDGGGDAVRNLEVEA